MPNPDRSDSVSRPADRGLSRRSFLEVAGGGSLIAAGCLLTTAGRAYPHQSTKNIRLAVVGGGFGASFWWHEHPNCTVTAVTDLYPQRRKRLRDRYSCDNVYDTFEELIEKEKKIDAVAVFSGAPDHPKHVKMAMEHGCHAISAVPACMTLEEAQMMADLKQKTGLKYMMAESSWYRQEVIFARNFFREGGFGELFYSELEYYHDRGDLKRLVTNKGGLPYNPDGSKSWRWGFPPMHYPTHSLGCLVGVTGERIISVSCLGWGKNTPELRDHPTSKNAYGNPFWCQASLMRTDAGHMVRGNEFRRCVAGGERAQWFGDKATLYMPLGGVHGPVQKIRNGASGEWAVPQYWKSDMLPEKMRHASGHGGSAVFISAEFINALVEDREPEIDLYESLAMTVPGIVGHQSALKDGRQMAVPQFERPKT